VCGCVCVGVWVCVCGCVWCVGVCVVCGCVYVGVCVYVVCVFVCVIEANAVVLVRSALCWDFAQRRVVVCYDVSGQTPGCIFRGEGTA